MRYVLSLSLIMFFTTVSCAQSNENKSITVDDLKTIIDNPEVVVLDVRTPAELVGPLGKIDGSINIPVQELASRMNELKSYKDKEILVICRTQNRSSMATDLLIKNGYNAKYVMGGMTQYFNSVQSEK